MKNNIKNYLGCLCLCFATASVQASGDIHDLMDCTKDILYNRTGGFEVLAELANSIQYSIENPEDKEQVAQLASQCRTHHKASESAVVEEQVVYEELVNNLYTAPAIKKIFHGFINPTYSCQKAGIYGSLAFIKLNFGSGADIAYCSSTLGNRWIEFRPFFDSGIGVGVYAGGGVSYGWDNQISYTSLPISFTPRYGAEIEFGGGVAGKVSSNRQLVPNTFGVGLGYGSKFGARIGAQLDITTLPFSNSYTNMIRFLSLSDLKEREEPEDAI